MIKSYKVYVKEGSRIASNTFHYNIKNYLKFYLFMFINMVLNLFQISRPISQLANVKLAKTLSVGNEISIENCFSDLKKPKKLWILLINQILLGTLIGAVLTPIILVGVGRNVLQEASNIYDIPYYNLINNTLNISFILFIIVLLVVVLLIVSNFFLASFVIEDEEINLKALIVRSISLAKKERKIFFELFFSYIAVNLGFVVSYTLILFIILSNMTAFMVLGIIMMVILCVFTIVSIPWLYVTFISACYKVYEDIKDERLVDIDSAEYIENSTKVDEYIIKVNSIYEALNKNDYDNKSYNKITNNYNKTILILNNSKRNLNKEKCEEVISYFISSTKKENIKKNTALYVGISLMAVLSLLFFVIGSIPKVLYKETKSGMSVVGIKGLIFSFHLPVNTITISGEVDGYVVEVIEENAFKNSNIRNIVLPESIRYIKNGAFEGCKNLRNISTYIDSKLCSNTINCETIGDRAFKGCKNLKSITLKDKINYIGNESFAKCYDLEILYDGTKYQWQYVTNMSELYNFKYIKSQLVIVNDYVHMAPNIRFGFKTGDTITSVDLSQVVLPTGYVLGCIVDKAGFVIIESDGIFVKPFTIKEDTYLYVEVCPMVIDITLYDTKKVISVSYGSPYELPYQYKEGYKFVGYFTLPNGKGVQKTDEYGISLGNSLELEDITLYPYYEDAYFTYVDKDENIHIINYDDTFTIERAPYISYYEDLWDCKFEGYALYNPIYKYEIIITDKNGNGVAGWCWDVRLKLYGYFRHSDGSKFLMEYEDLFRPYY